MPIVSGATSSALSGVSVTGTAASGQVPVASSSSAGVWKYPPGFEFGYDEITSGVNITGTTAATATTIITCAAHTFDGAAVLVEFYSPQVALDTGAAGDTLGIDLWEGASDLGGFSFLRSVITASQNYATVRATHRFTPSAGSHTYLLKAYASSTTGTPSINGGAGGAGINFSAFVRFTKA
jgi:hypothetical protein